MISRDRLGDIANIVTLLGLPVTLASLLSMFSSSTVRINLPGIPGGSALLLLVYVLVSVAFGRAFASWIGLIERKLKWSRLVVVPTIGLVSVAQTFFMIEMLFGPFGRSLNVGVFGLLMVMAVGLEVHYLLGEKLNSPAVLIFFKCSMVVLFGMIIAVEADPLSGVNQNNIAVFSVTYAVGVIMVSAILVGLYESGYLWGNGDEEL